MYRGSTMHCCYALHSEFFYINSLLNFMHHSSLQWSVALHNTTYCVKMHAVQLFSVHIVQKSMFTIVKAPFPRTILCHSAIYKINIASPLLFPTWNECKDCPGMESVEDIATAERLQ